MKIYLTYELKREQFMQSELLNYSIISMGQLFIKNNFNYTEQDYKIRFDLLTNEIVNINNDCIVFGNPCYSVDDIKLLSISLQNKNLSISGVYIPSSAQLDKQCKDAINLSYNHSAAFGDSESEILIAFEKRKVIIGEMIEYCKLNKINVYFK